MSKNYYLILGIASDATQDEIKSAYREKAKRWHPDRSGEGSEPFLAIREAYEVLCEPERRRAYDAERACQEAERRPTAAHIRSETLGRTRPPVEPLIPSQRPSSPREGWGISPLPSLLTDFLSPRWMDLDIPVRRQAGRGSGELQVDVSLTREQARRGGRIRLQIPVWFWCPACQGQGQAGAWACPQCLGTGTVVSQSPVEFTFPGGVVDGSVGEVSVARRGMRDLALSVHFSVDEQV
jgi:molecular chaperone DnaJ